MNTGIFVGRLECMRPLGRLRDSWEDNIMMDLLRVWAELIWLKIRTGRRM
jgi:hypothetical protein